MISFFVPGTPVPQGSMQAFVAGGRAVVVQGGSKGRRASLAGWRADVREAAERSMNGAPPLGGAVAMMVWFWFQRPASHYGTGRNAETLKSSAPEAHSGAPDLDKLVRAVLDAMSGVVFADDKQVAWVEAQKGWGLPGTVGANVRATQFKSGWPPLVQPSSPA